MKLLYGVVGEGMGHATRSRVVLEHLARQGHEVRVVASNRAYHFLQERLVSYPNVQVHEIAGLRLRYDRGGMKLGATIASNLRHAPASALHNMKLYQALQRDGFRPDAVFSDFESWAWLYAMNHRIPLISIDNQQAMTRCHHTTNPSERDDFSFRLARFFIRGKVPFAYHYLVSGFFFPQVAQKRTTLLPPILRPEILAAKREPGEHVLVYHHSVHEPYALEALRKLPYQFRIYGSDKPGQWDNLTFCAFDEHQFVEDLRTAKAVVAGGGFSLMCEAVHLRVPLFSIPIANQAEQLFNARYLKQLGYGTHHHTFDPKAIHRFIEDHRVYERGLKQYTPHDNQMLFSAVDEVLHHIDLGEPAPDSLASPSLGTYTGPSLPRRWQRQLALQEG